MVTLRRMTPDQRLEHQQEPSDAAAALGHWLEEAGKQPDRVPTEVLARIRDASARVFSAATLLAGGEEKTGD